MSLDLSKVSGGGTITSQGTVSFKVGPNGELGPGVQAFLEQYKTPNGGYLLGPDVASGAQTFGSLTASGTSGPYVIHGTIQEHNLTSGEKSITEVTPGTNGYQMNDKGFKADGSLESNDTYAYNSL